MRTKDSHMSDVINQNETRDLCERTTWNEHDTVGEKINMGLILAIGILSMVNSIAMVVYSVVQVIIEQQFLIELLKTLIVSALLLAIGLGSLYLFRKRLRVLSSRKNNPWRL